MQIREECTAEFSLGHAFWPVTVATQSILLLVAADFVAAGNDE